jgi:YD repeat-containing protein
VTRGTTDYIRKTLEWSDGINLTAIRDNLDPPRTRPTGTRRTTRCRTRRDRGRPRRLHRPGRQPTFLDRNQNNVATTDVYSLLSGTNRIAGIDRDGAPTRRFTYDGGGNILSDAKNGVTTTYGYDAAGRLASVDVGGSGRGPYLYNGFGQLVSRTMTAGVPASTVHYVHDRGRQLSYR